MMINYYLSKVIRKHDEKFPIHRESCKLIPGPNDRIYLGNFHNCQEALDYATRHYNMQIDGCLECSVECHKKNF